MARKPNKAPKRKALRKIIRQEATSTLMKLSETKYHDKDYALGADLNGAIVDLSSIGQGSTDVTRDGDKALPTSLFVGFSVIGETYSGIVRMIIFRWIDTGIPTPGNICEGLGGNYATISPFVHDLRGNFQVLRDKHYRVSNNGGSEIVTDVFTMKLAKKTLQYYQGGVSARNKIYALLITDRSLATSPNIYLTTRMNYKDF